MSKRWEAAKEAVMARLCDNDAHMETCELCGPYVEELIRVEMENCSATPLSTAGLSVLQQAEEKKQ